MAERGREALGGIRAGRPGRHGLERAEWRRLFERAGWRRVLGRAGRPGRSLFDRAEWPPGRVAGEVVLAVVLALLAVGSEMLGGEAGPRTAAVVPAVMLLSPLRRALPTTVLVVAGALSGAVDGFTPLLMMTGWSAGRRIPGVWRTVGAFSLAFGLSTVTAVVRSPHEGAVPLLAISLVFFLATVVMPGLAGRYWWQRRELLHTLREHNEQLLREHAMVAGQARLRERQRIAQDMHDSLGHQLSLIAVHTGALEVDRELTGQQREAVGVLREASVAAMRELREVVGILRDGTEAPEQTEDARPAARGVQGVERLVEASRGAGTDVRLERAGEPRPLAPAADHAAYRIAQEGLTNAHKHAPGAPITVALRYEPDSLVVEVANGSPAPVPAPVGGPGQAAGGAAGQAGPPRAVGAAVSGGQGLTGLRERARLIGGMVHAGPSDGGGFRLAGVLPYAAENGSRRPQQEQGPPEPPARGAVRSGPVTAGAPGTRPGEVDWSPPRHPVESGARPGQGSGSGGIAAGCAIAALIVLAVGAVVVWGVVRLVMMLDESMIDPKTYESVRVGQSEAEVREKLPAGESLLTDGLADGAPPRPEGTECLMLMSSESSADWNAEPAYRFCFRDGKLVEKRSYESRS
ncbi:histidine kinase [Streptomyces sp. NPDC048845]|uniref:sensor histidine kinase n=1 Tax=Streptomyces sp. NPDC048845 TaxID=3155390 RepID=UPI003422520B